MSIWGRRINERVSGWQNQRGPLSKDDINRGGLNALWQIALVGIVLVGIVVIGNYITG